MMKRAILVIVLLSSAAFAQKTTVTAQVIDSNNTVYQNCRYSVTFVGQSSLPGPYLISGSVFQTDFPGIGCDGFGNLSVQLYPNSLISPAPSQWRFDVCDTTGKFCGFLLVTISGGSQNITTLLTPAMPILPISGGGGSPPCGSNGQIQFNNLGVFGCAPGLTSDISGNTLIPGTLGVTGAVSGTTAGFTGNVSALSFTATGPGAIHFHTAFGQAQATPISGQNGCTFATGDGSLQCYSNGGGLAGFLSQGPPASQNVVQPSVGGATLGTSLNSNSFEQVRYADQFQWSQSPAGTITAAGTPAPITNFSITTNVVSFTAANTLSAGQTVFISGLATGTYLNNATLVVSATGLSGAGFQAPFTHANVGSTGDTGTATLQNVVTINAVRGISQYSFAPGVLNFGSLSFVTHPIRIAGTGTPEVVTINGSTCIGASSGTCTVTVTALNAHSAGYTIGTATAGIQEAIVDTFVSSVANANLAGWTVKLSPYLNTHNFVIYGTINIEQVLGTGGGLHLNCEQGSMEDAVQNAAMIRVGGNHTSANIWPSQTMIDHCHFGISIGNLGRAATGNQVFVWDRSQSLTLAENNWDSFQNGTDLVDGLVLVSGDQHFTFRNNVINSPAWTCDTTFCRAEIYGDHTSNSAIGAFYDNYFNGDAIEWVSHNGMTLHGNVFQNWSRFPWRYEAGLAGINDLGGNYYEGGAGIVNPDFGVAGYSINTGRQVSTSGSIGEYAPGQDEAVGVIPHSFSNTGASVYTYYIVGHLGTTFSRPLFVGTASTDGVTNFNVLFLQFGADTYDVLRSGPNANDGTDAAPWGTGNWAVSTGIVCASSPCTYTETFAAPTAYTVHSEFQSQTYCPVIAYWPVPLFLHGGCNSPSMYRGPAISGFVSTASSNSYVQYYDAIFTSELSGLMAITGMHIWHQAPVNSGATANNNPGAMILNPDSQVNNMSNRKGRINMPSLSFHGGATWANNCLYHIYDPEANKTLVTNGHQPLVKADGSDACVGYDTNQAFPAFQGGTNGTAFYAGHVMDSRVSDIFEILSTGLKINKGIAQSSGSGYQAIRTVAGCATAASLAATCTTTVTWTSAFGDANYTPHCDGLAITSGVPINGGITAKLAASVTFQTVSATAAAAQFTNIVCSAIHD